MAENVKRINVFSKYNIPEQIGTTLGLIGVILLLTYLFPDKDFGIIKIPKFDEYNIVRFLVGVLLISSNFPFFKIESKVFDVISYSQSRQLHSEFGTMLKSIKNEVIFWGGNFYISVNEHKATILDRLINGIKIKYLIFNPESTLCGYASKDFDENENHFYDQCITTIKNLRDLENEWGKNKKLVKTSGGSLEIKLYSNIPRLRTYMIDPHDVNAYSYFVHFMYNLDSSDLPVYKVRNGVNGIFKSYLNSFNKLWEDEENTITFENFLETTNLKF